MVRMNEIKNYFVRKLISCIGLRASSVAVVMVILGLMLSSMIPVVLAGSVTNSRQDRAFDNNDNQDFQNSLSYLEAHSDELGIKNPYEEFRLRGIYRDELGQTHVRLDQIYNEIPVFGKQLIVHFNNDGTPKSVNGAYQAGIDVSTQPKLSTSEAREKAQKNFPGRFTRTEESELVLYLQDEKAVLVYRIALENDAPPRRRVAFIDARNGEKIFSYNDLRTPFPSVEGSNQLQSFPTTSFVNRLEAISESSSTTETGTGHSLYSGMVSINTAYESGVYTMLDPSLGGLYTTDMEDERKNKRDYYGIIFTDSDNIWGDGTNNDRATAGVDAHFGAEMTWDYYLNKHGREGIKGDGIGTISRVHYGKDYNNAYWSNRLKCVTYGDGDGTLFSPLVSLDVVGHEITHGVTIATADLIYNGESGGLNEAMSDIFGTMIEYYAYDNGAETTPDYLIGEDIYTPSILGDALRYMDDPTFNNNPSIDHYSEYYDGIDVHYSSGIGNNAFYLLAEGGTHREGDVVTEIGKDKAEQIFYRALTVYMIESETFSQARTNTIQAAEDLYPSDEDVVSSVEQAWSAVGVE